MSTSTSIWNVFGVPAVFLALLGVARLMRDWYRLSLGHSRQIRRSLSKLGCGITFDYVDSLFSSPIIVNENENRILRIYRTREVYLCVTAPKDTETVDAFCITVRRTKFHINTIRWTGEQLALIVGRDTFHNVPATGRNGRLWILGARRFGYVESYSFGNPGYYQTYLVAYNDAGCEQLNLPSSKPSFSTGIFSHLDASLPTVDSYRESERFFDAIPVNTFGVIAQSSVDLNLLFNGINIGVDRDIMRVIPDGQRLFWWWRAKTLPLRRRHSLKRGRASQEALDQS